MKNPLIRAAEYLEQYARELKTSYTLRPDYRWPDHDDEHKRAHADHDELLKLARQLREEHRSKIGVERAMSEALNSGDGTYRP